MALTQLQVINVCNPYTVTGYKPEHCCRYLSFQYDPKIGYVHLCTKLAPGEYAKLKAKHPTSSLWGGGGGVARDNMGDNCGGFLFLKHKKQGYDVP